MTRPIDLDEEFESSVRRSGAIRNLFELVAEHSLWVSPLVVRLVDGPVFPGTRRKRGRMEKRGDIVDGLMLWENQPARHAFWAARGEEVRSGGWPKSVAKSWVCHIYGDLDSAQDPRHFTHLANLVALPKCIQSLTDWAPVREVLKWRSFASYGYKGLADREPVNPKPFPPDWPGLDENMAEERAREIARVLIDLRTRQPTYGPNPSATPRT
jgi:hypothetical protein